MVPGKQPEWTIGSFIFNGPWWTNRGEATWQVHKIELIPYLNYFTRDSDPQHYADSSSADIRDKWVGFVFG